MRSSGTTPRVSAPATAPSTPTPQNTERPSVSAWAWRWLHAIPRFCAAFGIAITAIAVAGPV